jgi:SAM-dependent methyltransferase
MPGRAVYDLLYRLGAARWRRGWDAGTAPELLELVEDGTLAPSTIGGSRALDLGCGSGANVRYLAQRGFDAVGVDFSRTAITQAEDAARAADVDAAFIVADITKPVPGLGGPFDLILLYNVLQDLDPGGRPGLAEVTTALARPGTRVLLWCWYARKRDLPLVSYRGPSRIAPFVVEPGEEEALFGDAFDIAPASRPGPMQACFVLVRRERSAVRTARHP